MSLRTFNYQYPYNEFWLLIEEAQGSRERFHKLIEPFSYEELRAYQDEFFRVKFWTDAHRAVIEHIDPYGSPVDTRLFVISQGYDYYQKLSKNPNQLPAGIRADHPQILYYTIARVIETKYKDRFFDYKDPSNRFWQLIERAQGSQKKLYKLIESLTYDELSMYRRQFFKAQDYLWSKDYPEELKLRKTSFNNFFYNTFCYVVSQGYKYYQNILQNPEKLPSNIEKDHPKILYGVIEQVMRDKYVDKLFDHTDPHNRFWKYIEAAESDRAKFYEIVSDLSFEELQDYEEAFTQAEETLWKQGRVASSDEWEDARYYVVSQGYAYYMDVLRGVKSLPRGIDDGNPKLIYGAILRVMIDKYQDY